MPSTARMPPLNSRTSPSARIPLSWDTPSRLRAGDLGDRARPGPDVLRGRPDQPALALLLEDVSAPAGDARAREQRGEQVGRDLGRVEYDGRPELDVRGQHAV